MRKLRLGRLGLAALLAVAPGCQRKSAMQVEVTEKESPKLATVIHVADPQTSVQLVKGFYELEQNSWRWTASRFAVVLRPPRGGAERGALLRLNFSLPVVVVERVRSVTLKARVGQVELAPETYAKAGEYVYAREVPATALGGDGVGVEFETDKFLPRGAVEERELALVVSAIGLELK